MEHRKAVLLHSGTIARAAVTALVAAALAVQLAGCSQQSAPSGEATRQSAVYNGEVPTFSGPWASEFADAYRSTKSGIVHRILEKGSITDQDYAEVSSAYVKCMANKGFTARVTGPAGESITEAGTESFGAEEMCNPDLAVIATLRGNMLRNPENRSEEEIVAACLVERKVAPPGYSARDYEADLKAEKFPYSVDDRGFSKCVNDPLGLASGR